MPTTRCLTRFTTTQALALAALGHAASSRAAPVALSASGDVKAFARATLSDTENSNRTHFQSADPVQDFRIGSSARSVSRMDPSNEAQSSVGVEADWSGAEQGSVYIDAALGGFIITWDGVNSVLGLGEQGVLGLRHPRPRR